MELKHTKGPWKWSGFNWRAEPVAHKLYVTGDYYEDEEGESCTGVCIVEGNATSREVTEANARLIAAAPELLNACKSLLYWFPNLTELVQTPNAKATAATLLDMALTAVEKAEWC